MVDRNAVQLDRVILEVADLRYIGIEQRGGRQYLRPICPAALLAVIEFLRLRVALKSDARSLELIHMLNKALQDKDAVRSQSARGYIKETLFLTRLQRLPNQHIAVNHTVKVSGKQRAQTLSFWFTLVATCERFTKYPDLSDDEKQNKCILFLPDRTNERFVDAAVFDYTRRYVIAIQVSLDRLLCRCHWRSNSSLILHFEQITAETPCAHAKSLRFFTEQVCNTFKLLPDSTPTTLKKKPKAANKKAASQPAAADPAGQQLPAAWKHYMVWVLTKAHPNSKYPECAGVEQFSMQTTGLGTIDSFLSVG